MSVAAAIEQTKGESPFLKTPRCKSSMTSIHKTIPTERRAQAPGPSRGLGADASAGAPFSQHETPEERDIERRIESYFLQWQNANGPKQRQQTGTLLTRAINERNALRTPERVAEIEKQKGLR